MLSISVYRAEWSNVEEVFWIKSAVTLKWTLIWILNRTHSSILAQTLYKILNWLTEYYLNFFNLFFITWTLAFLWVHWLDLYRTSNVIADAMASQSLFEVKGTDKGFCCDHVRFYFLLSCLSACSDCKASIADPDMFAQMHFSQCNNLVSWKNWGTGSQTSPLAGLWCPFITSHEGLLMLRYTKKRRAVRS